MIPAVVGSNPAAATAAPGGEHIGQHPWRRYISVNNVNQYKAPVPNRPAAGGKKLFKNKTHVHHKRRFKNSHPPV